MGLIGKLLNGQTRVQFIQNATNTVIQFDASIKEVHSKQSTATEFPIENGPTISDHMIPKPQKLELTGIISDTPIGDLKGLLTEAATTVVSRLTPPIGIIGLGAGFALFNALSKSSRPSVAAYGQLLQLQANAQSFDVITSLFRYSNMYIESISVPRDSETGRVLLFTVSLIQLTIVTPQSVNIQIFANPGMAAPKADVGQQSTGIPSGFEKGLDKSTSIINSVAGRGPSGGT
jgi:hypothetical protein